MNFSSQRFPQKRDSPCFCNLKPQKTGTVPAKKGQLADMQPIEKQRLRVLYCDTISHLFIRVSPPNRWLIRSQSLSTPCLLIWIVCLYTRGRGLCELSLSGCQTVFYFVISCYLFVFRFQPAKVTNAVINVCAFVHTEIVVQARTVATYK